MLRVPAEKSERIKQSSEDTPKFLEEMEKNMTGGAGANNTYTAFGGAHRQQIEGLVTAGILGSVFQPGISGKEMLC